MTQFHFPQNDSAKNQEKRFRYPWFLTKNFIILVVLFFVITRILMGFNVLTLRNGRLFADVTAIDLLTLINETRAQYHLDPLVENTKLDLAAYLKAQDMLQNNYFDHYSPSGKSPWDFIDSTGYYFQYAGENLAMNFFDSREALEAWMNSPLHRANILNPNYKETGIAVLRGKIPLTGEERTLVVEMFGALPKTSEVALAKTVAKTATSSTTTSTTIVESQVASEETNQEIAKTNQQIQGTTQEQELMPKTSETAFNLEPQLNVPTETPTNVAQTSSSETKTLNLPAVSRSPEVADNLIRQTKVSEELRKQIIQAERERIANNDHLAMQDWVKYHLTSLWNTQASKIANEIFGLILVSLSCFGIWIMHKSNLADNKIKMDFLIRNTTLGSLGLCFILIQPLTLFSHTIVPLL